MQQGRNSWPAIMIVSTAAAVVLAWGGDAATGDDMSVQKNLAGIDPHRFATAAKMYETEPVRAVGALDQQYVARVTLLVDKQTLPETAEMVQMLENLNPCRQAEPIQAALNQWLAAWATIPAFAHASPGKDAAAEFETLCQAYEQEVDLGTMADFYDFVRRHPGHFDARNNLALCALHLGLDLIAQIHLELILLAKPNYVPAMVNLTVVHERNGRSNQARELAARAFRIQSEAAPQVAFNEAWYLSLEGNHKKAAAHLKPLVKHDVKYASFHSLTATLFKTTLRSASFWHHGLAGKVGARRSWASQTLAVVLFLVVSFFLLALLVAIAEGMAGGSAFVLGAVVACLGYVLAWGMPLGGLAYLLVAAYLLFAGAVASAATTG